MTDEVWWQSDLNWRQEVVHRHSLPIYQYISTDAGEKNNLPWPSVWEVITCTILLHESCILDRLLLARPHTVMSTNSFPRTTCYRAVGRYRRLNTVKVSKKRDFWTNHDTWKQWQLMWTTVYNVYFVPRGGARHCGQRFCTYVSLSARISRKLLVESSTKCRFNGT